MELAKLLPHIHLHHISYKYHLFKYDAVSKTLMMNAVKKEERLHI